MVCEQEAGKGFLGRRWKLLRRKENPPFSRKQYRGHDIVEKKKKPTVFVVIVQISHSLGVWMVLGHCICERNRNREHGLLDDSMLYWRALSLLEGFSKKSPEMSDHCHSAQVRDTFP